MNVKHVFEHFCSSSKLPLLLDKLRLSEIINIKNVNGSGLAFIVAGVYNLKNIPLFIVLPDANDAEYFKSDLENLLGENSVFLLPDSCLKPFEFDNLDTFKVQKRIEIINKISKQNKAYIIITYPESLCEKIISDDEINKAMMNLKIGDKLDLDFVVEFLNEYHFERVDFVYEPGQYSVRGGIIDIFSFSNDNPYRIELDGDTVESIRAFDTISQLSISNIAFAGIIPNISESEIKNSKKSIWNILNKDAVLFFKDFDVSLNIIKDAIDKIKDENEINNWQDKLDTTQFIKSKIIEHTIVEIGGNAVFHPKAIIDFELKSQPVFYKKFELLVNNFEENNKSGIKTLIFSETGKQIERLNSILEDINAKLHFTPVYKGISNGFIDVTGKTAYYTEHQIFNKFYRYKQKNRYTSNQAITLKELKDLTPGDFVVHIDHGIGKFEGLQKIEMAGTLQEAVRIRYKNDDLLYVNIHSLHKISKYTGKEGTEPVLNKLGSDAWQNLKRKTKSKVKDIARDLIKLYAMRKAQPGYSFSPDNYLLTELEASFIYEETSDQAKAIEDVKNDMHSPHPMDRLVCGDVGFGKTEVAIRAAFKAVCDSKQVAILVPTTILAQQHYHTFKDRLEDFPVKVDYLNRFCSTKKQNETIKNLSEGKVDIIIATHKLLSKKIKFHDLGLLIIDEEQKFGVANKDKLKEIKVNVDTLTLTATPIPRTLHFSIMGARDLSIINTPPANRQAVSTSLNIFNKQILKQAIDNELKRGGQIFFVHNRVKDINEMAMQIRLLCPDAKVCVGHGQLSGDELENVMLKFVEGEYDVLVATNIIESGLDISNANTIIINNAHFFGLSDLHQMRGRVGRSNKKAYCYLICPPIHTLNEEAKRRLKAIEEFSDLGSGFNVAMRDLDIRGAGNLLGSEQSGFIADIGFDMYHKILDEAVRELKETEFAGVFDKNEIEQNNDCQIETDLDIMIPDNYVRNISERLSLYNELAAIKNIEKLEEFDSAIKDRFGKIPPQVRNLIRSMVLKWKAKNVGFEKLILKNGKFSGQFIKNDKYYQQADFGKILDYVRQNPNKTSLKQTNDSLWLKCDDIKNIDSAISLIDSF
ncbi:MAG: transcription-repair coupling factor [Bacteroidia bacterium]|nr:transcription-repair coupling factor [Bacteroidia bacterium]